MTKQLNTTNASLQHGLQNKLLFTIDEASHMLNISPGMIRKLARTGRIKTTHIGKCVRLSQETLLNLCNGETAGGVK